MIALALTLTLLAAPESARLSDGATLVVIPMAGEDELSFRMFVHAGSTADPFGRVGLAHVVEHLIFRGSDDLSQRALFERTRELGLTINAHTGLERTTYELDGERAATLSFLPSFIGAITSPTLNQRHLGIERAVVAAEAMLRSSLGISNLALGVLSPELRERASIIGGGLNRDRITIEDARAFIAERYRPRNITFLFAGNIGLEEARALVESSSRLAPHPDEAPPIVADDALSTPLELATRAPVYLSLVAYDISGEAEGCEQLATLAALRLEERLGAAHPTEAACLSAGSHSLLLALTRSFGLAEADNLDVIDATLKGLSSPPSAAESKRISRRARALADRRAKSPSAAIEAAVDALERSRSGDVTSIVARALEVQPIDVAAMRRAVKAGIKPSRRIAIRVRP